MSFSSRLKISLSHLPPAKRCCRIAELSALVRLNGSIDWDSEEPKGLALNGVSTAPMRIAHDLFLDLFDIHPTLEVTEDKSLGRSHRYRIELPESTPFSQILNEIGVLSDTLEKIEGIHPRIVKSPCCRISYARGAFIAAGSITDPRSSYHLEIVTHSDAWAEQFIALLSDMDIEIKKTIRKGASVLYVKGSESIAAYLALIGGHAPLLEFEEILVKRELRNDINRLVNCDAANARKTATSAQKQLADIHAIAQRYGLTSLPVALREIAEARLESPDISIAELAEAILPPLSKSAAAHRLRRIGEIAVKIHHDSR